MDTTRKMIQVLVLMLIAMLLMACVPPGLIDTATETDEPARGGSDGSPDDDEFNYATQQKVGLRFYTDIAGAEVSVLNEDGGVLATYLTNASGDIVQDITVAATATELTIVSNTLGLPSELTIAISGGIVEVNLERSAAISSTAASRSLISRALTSSTQYQDIGSLPSYQIIGNWNNDGVPDYLTTSATITADLLTWINDALPEKQPVPEFRPQYLAEAAASAIEILDTADVFVTFIHEGAGYRNSLGFYTFQTVDGPPTEVAHDDITLIFPNVSYRYSGGGLLSGDRVKIGRFAPGTSIGWVLMSNAYSTRSGGVSGGIHQFHSHDSLNPDQDGYKRHVVQLLNDDQEMVILSFEDLLRPGGDNDFNDAVFTVDANPVEAIRQDQLVTDTNSYVNTAPPEPETPVTEAPAPDASLNITGYQYFPAQDSFGSLAYEDLWPHKGDYDFNDLVIDYNFREALDDTYRIVQIDMSFRITGILASMHNGFGIQLGIKPDLVKSVSGGQYTKGYTVLSANGTEARQEKAVIIIFEDAQEHFNPADPESSELLTITVELTRGVTRQELGYAPYNPFIMSNGERGREVHLPGYQPTSLVHYDYFNSVDDASVLGTSRMYKSEDLMPWAINLPSSFDYPYDGVEVHRAYRWYNVWVESLGGSYADWYDDSPGYREVSLLARITP